MKIFLLSESIMSIYENGIKIKSEIDKNNSFAENLTKSISSYDSFLFICNNKRAYEANDKSAKMIFDALIDGGYPFKEYFVLDKRSQKDAKSLIEKAGFIYLQGGTLPGQLRFLKKIRFKENIKNSKAVVAGKSAGAMNLGSVVYAFPEKTIEKFKKRFLKGLGYYEYVIIPHFNLDKNGYEFDVGIDLVNKYFIPNSRGRKFYALPQGSYIFLDDDRHFAFGETYIIENGQIKKICENEQSIALN